MGHCIKVFVEKPMGSSNLCVARYHFILHHYVVHIQTGSTSCLQWLDNLFSSYHIQILFKKRFCITVQILFLTNTSPWQKSRSGSFNYHTGYAGPTGTRKCLGSTPSLAAAAVMPTITVAHYYYIIEPGCPCKKELNP